MSLLILFSHGYAIKGLKPLQGALGSIPIMPIRHDPHHTSI